MQITRSNIVIRANPKRVILRALASGTNPFSRSKKHFIDRVLSIPEEEVEELMNQVETLFNHRHTRLHQVLLENFQKLSSKIPNEQSLSDKRKMLLGAYYTKEFSIQAAALFNPSIIDHPDQSNLKSGEKRFIMSLRSVGEGHISSIEFRSGVIDLEGGIVLDKESRFATCSLRDESKVYNKEEVRRTIRNNGEFDDRILNELGENFNYSDYKNFRKTENYKNYHPGTKDLLDSIIDLNYDVISDGDDTISERVIFPYARLESMGMEDVRLVQFTHGETNMYVGTYTAYDGKGIRPQLIITEDFIDFRIRSLNGKASSDKGMALFPEKINGRYTMIGRQGGENMSIMYSDDLFHWDTYELLATPKYGWEILQIGNCGSPIKTEKGWLLMTHGVGPIRRYAISAMLLDLKDPRKVIRRMDMPLISPSEEEREGYVPNTVYSCGSLVHGANLIIPYALSDSAATFATVSLDELLNEMQSV